MFLSCHSKCLSWGRSGRRIRRWKGRKTRIQHVRSLSDNFNITLGIKRCCRNAQVEYLSQWCELDGGSWNQNDITSRRIWTYAVRPVLTRYTEVSFVCQVWLVLAVRRWNLHGYMHTVVKQNKSKRALTDMCMIARQGGGVQFEETITGVQGCTKPKFSFRYKDRRSWLIIYFQKCPCIEAEEGKKNICI